MLDSASISSPEDGCRLQYLEYDKVVHCSDVRLEVYDFSLDLNSQPYKIKISPQDSLTLSVPPKSSFFDVVRISNENLLIIMNEHTSANKKKNGEFTYWLAITQHIPL